MAGEKHKTDYSKRTPGEIVRTRREDLNISQMELSLMTKMSVQNINRIEKNKSNPTIKTIIRLEEMLDISLFPSFIEYQKRQQDFKPDLSETILILVSKQEMTEIELRNMFEKIIVEYLKRK